MSVRICSGIPCRRSAANNASHTGFAVARRTSVADTANLELSSMPDTASQTYNETKAFPAQMETAA